MRAMILAAGKGTRMGTLTDDRPKALIELGGEALIERQLRRLAAAGIREVVVNLAGHGQQIRDRLGDGRAYGVTIAFSDEGPEPLETAGGIINAMPLLGRGPFVVVNADVVSDFDFARLVGLDGPGTLVLVPNPPHNSDGDYGLDPASRLTDGPPRLTFAGISVLSQRLFAGFEPGPLPLARVFAAAIGRRALRGLVHDGLWIDVGTPERLTTARRAAAPGP